MIVRQYGHFISLYWSLVVSRLYELLYITESTFGFGFGAGGARAEWVEADDADGASFVYIVMILDERFLGNKEHF